MTLQQNINPGTTVSFVVNNIINPRSTESSLLFKYYTTESANENFKLH